MLKRNITGSCTWLAVLCLAGIALAGCGGGGSSVTTSELAGIIRGVVYAPDGETIVSDATVYIPSGRAASPPEQSIAWTVSRTDGSFVLENIPRGVHTVKIIKNDWTRSFEVTVESGSQINIPKSMTILLESIDLPPGGPFQGGDGTIDDPPTLPGIPSSPDSPPGVTF